jgi:hypothetical protein
MDQSSQSLASTEEITYINTPCPDWCTLPMLHPVDNQSLEDPRDDYRMPAGGRRFGEFLELCGRVYRRAGRPLVGGVALRRGGRAVGPDRLAGAGRKAGQAMTDRPMCRAL